VFAYTKDQLAIRQVNNLYFSVKIELRINSVTSLVCAYSMLLLVCVNVTTAMSIKKASLIFHHSDPHFSSLRLTAETTKASAAAARRDVVSHHVTTACHVVPTLIPAT